MGKLVSGIFLLLLGMVSLSNTQDTVQTSATLAVQGMFFLGGGALVYFGWKKLRDYKETIATALQMLRDDGKIHSGELAMRVGTSEVDVRGYLAQAQRKGLIPFKTEII